VADLPPDLQEFLPGTWFRVLKGRHGLIFDPEPYDGPACEVCQEPEGTHRTGIYYWTADDGRLMAAHACFADLDQLGGWDG
jgi:hypothetical protein